MHGKEREIYQGSDGRTAIVSHLRLRDEWAASLCDAHGVYETLGVYPSREQARAALREEGEWEGLPGRMG